MARISGPLFSFAAAGSVNAITFSSAGNNNVARKKPAPSTYPATVYQLEIRSKTKTAAIAWAALDTPTKAKWAAKGILIHPASNRATSYHLSNGYALFLKEWYTQNITPPNIPLLPA